MLELESTTNFLRDDEIKQKGKRTILITVLRIELDT